MTRRAIAIASLLAVVPWLGPAVARAQDTSATGSNAGMDTTTHRIDAAPPSSGRIIREIVSTADTTQRYALLLPSAFTAERRWPVLFVLDPRGRALIPLRRFQHAADQLGYIVLSSYNTLSDGPVEPNVLAMRAMLEDVQRALPVDTRRLYLVGFSGTARFAWELVAREPGTYAGVVGAGASVPGGESWIRAHIGRSSPVLFGTIGLLDPNYEEMRRFDAVLDDIGTAHRIERFGGGHEWPPDELAGRALAWLRLQAMRRDLVPRDQRWVDSLYSAWRADAARLDSPGSGAEAARAYRSLVADFDALANVAPTVERLHALDRDPRVRQAARTEADAAQRDARYSATILGFARALEQPTPPPSLEQSRQQLGLDALMREAASADSAAAIVARRALVRAFTQLSFYTPRALLDRRRYAQAARALELAHSLRPDDGGTCFWLAGALAQLNETSRALDALACAARSQEIRAARMSADSLLAPLRGTPRFDEIVRSAP